MKTPSRTSLRLTLLRALPLASLLAAVSPLHAAQGASSTPRAAGGAEWNATAAEHLLNRAGFGANPAEIAEAVRAGREATVDRLLKGGAAQARPAHAEPPRELRRIAPVPPVLVDGPMFDEDPSLVLLEQFYVDKGQLRRIEKAREHCAGWIAEMLRGDDPLRDRLALFWHGHFVSSLDEVGDPNDLIRQIEFLRANALGNFEAMVRGIARDPAMLEYLNNDINEKAHPNENWARELMELFTLGEGNYTETDIKEAARAFSGWTRHDHAFAFARDKHDYGPKTVLGVTGNLDGDAVIDILLAQEACPRFVAGKLITYLEGEAPSSERLEAYAKALRESGFQIDALLRKLFLDPEFYRPGIVGNRVAAPLEFFVGTTRRLGIQVPADMLFVASALAGQQLFAPPNVKGWEEGMSWLTTSNVMQRSNLVGALLGEFDRQMRPGEILATMIEARGREFTGPYRDFLAMTAWLQGANWEVDLPLGDDLKAAGPTSDEQVVSALLDRLLPVPPAAGTAAELAASVAAWRAKGADRAAPLYDPSMHVLFKQLVHVMLSLPEAQVL